MNPRHSAFTVCFGIMAACAGFTAYRILQLDSLGYHREAESGLTLLLFMGLAVALAVPSICRPSPR